MLRTNKSLYHSFLACVNLLQLQLTVFVMQRAAWTLNAQAVGWVSLGTAVFSLIYASGKFADGTASPVQILFLRYVGGFSLLAVYVISRRESWCNHVSIRPLSHLLRTFFGVYGTAAIIYASAEMPIADATAISLLYVIFMIALGVVVLRERIRAQHWPGIILCCCGAAIVMTSRGAFRSFEVAYLWPAFVALVGAALFAIEGVMIRALSQVDKPLTVLLYVNFFGILLLLIPAFATWKSMAFIDNALFMLLGPLVVCGQYFVILGYRIADIAVVGPAEYSWLIFAALIGLVFFGEVPTPGVVAGSVAIAVGGILIGRVKPKAGCERCTSQV